MGVGVAVAGLAVGIGIPAFYMQLDAKDEERLEELRELNRQTYKETGEYLSEVRQPSPLLTSALKSAVGLHSGQR